MIENTDVERRLRQQLYAMKNGVVADSLRAAGCPYPLIFGLNLPQLSEIAAMCDKSADVARRLWADERLREARLMATMIFPPEALTFDEALAWAEGVKWAEDADILVFKLLRNMPFAEKLAESLTSSPQRLHRYAGLRLWLSLVARFPQAAVAAADAELKRTDALRSLALLIKDEADFINCQTGS